jgi:hypothetical protein
MIAEHKQKVKTEDEKQQARLEVDSAVKKVIPGPRVLREGHGNQLNGGEHQQKAVDALKSAGQQSK